MSRTLSPLAPPKPPRGLGKLPAGRWFLLVGAIVTLLFAGSIAFTLQTMNYTREARATLIEVIDPMVLHTLELSTAVSNEEAAMRGYGRTNEAFYLQDYDAAERASATAHGKIEALLPRVPELRGESDRLVEAIENWRTRYAAEVVRQVPELGKDTAASLANVNTEVFGAVRDALSSQQAHLTTLHGDAATRLERGWDVFYGALASLAAVLLLAGIAFTLLVRYVVLRPVATLQDQVRKVAAGDFDTKLNVTRPAEMAELSGHVDAMRRRVLREWRETQRAQQALADQAAELKRSNSELEQFAYVASHDLQEPLRKVSSFSQMLEQRYGDQLDDRAKQYIKFAVDGAKRMQLLINDLLDFSRVGRVSDDRVPTSTADALQTALDNLAARIEDNDATVVHENLPVVSGNRMLLTQLFQNLIGNAIKFRSEDPPEIVITAERKDGMWEFACSDNGIGVDAKYADRIFLIFQRLHPRDVYPGTGIGLALCRKIVEYHGGRIWLEESPDHKGTTFRWTLEATDE
ncbi:ATP-binding protein [Herbidospora sp. NBRC 101105]|uniref:sensor histidine kinase n=1 Tax=Herbidospora sp. NBRC 101105 TaxID=3032195 RepID=UPI0024A47FAF|nr:ATP-binding protein [Herbidospora sp. NBRC 101105]GLX98929.1 histidine kinase [Herbidospora sp. NBRC 101105]